MASDGNALAEQLQKLGIDKVESYPNCHPDTNPVDIYRSHITGLLQEITGVDPKIIYPAIQWTQTLDKGDAILAVPALRVKGKKPGDLAEEWVSKVSRVLLQLLYLLTDSIIRSSPSLP